MKVKIPDVAKIDADALRKAAEIGSRVAHNSEQAREKAMANAAAESRVIMERLKNPPSMMDLARRQGLFTEPALRIPTVILPETQALLGGLVTLLRRANELGESGPAALDEAIPGLATEAISILSGIMRDEQAEEWVRVLACDAIVNASRRNVRR